MILSFPLVSLRSDIVRPINMIIIKKFLCYEFLTY